MSGYYAMMKQGPFTTRNGPFSTWEKAEAYIIRVQEIERERDEAWRKMPGGLELLRRIKESVGDTGEPNEYWIVYE